MAFRVSLVNFPNSAIEDKRFETLDAAEKAAVATGFECTIWKLSPADIVWVKRVSPIWVDCYEYRREKYSYYSLYSSFCFFLFFLVVLMAIGWLFGAKIKITDIKTKLPIGYVRWFTFHSYY